MRIVHKVLLANAVVLVPVISLAGALAYESVEGGFLLYVRDLEFAGLHAAEGRLADAYTRDHGWEGVRARPQRWGWYLRRETDPPGTQPPPDVPRSRPRASRDPLEIPARAVLFDASRRRVQGVEAGPDEVPLIPVRRGNEVIGYLGLRPIDRIASRLDLDYLSRLRRGLVVMAVAGIGLAMLASIFLSRHVLTPVRRLAAGAARLRANDFDVEIPVDSSDELGALGRDFNALAKTLGESRRLQRSWFAEASHELRTPLAVLRAYVDALEDGVRAPTPAAFASMRAQVLTLTRLVDDVHELARLDARGPAIRLDAVDPVAILRRVYDDFTVRFAARDLRAELVVAEVPALVQGDEERLTRLYANLLENSCRYTEPGGRVRVTTAVDAGRLRIAVDDSAPGVPPEQLEKIFRPFHRADASRSREHGGSGLGLAICARVVEAHHGEVSARASDLGGLRVEVVLPLC